MTREEAIQVLRQRPMIAPSKSNKQKMFEEAIDMAIEALSAEPKSSICKTCTNKDFCEETLRLYGLPNTRLDECVAYKRKGGDTE